ncbi:uncharacterized protein LOC131674025 isoform X2 [Phymastichus coffea]|uniref:uncharacterized protein LOC131674025 isoform X2 n=1 Tax=Phymastichus coffea TaxID=108790 RepID=UPI00273B013E|nr:uncharacterized protein LOC131674025 isoform X2 [Phymastichus coffea]
MMERINIDNLRAAIYWSAVKYQQNFYELSSDWNSYDLDEHIYLKKYIGYALYGPPKIDVDCRYLIDDFYAYEEQAMTVIESIYDQIVKHGTQLTNKKEVLCSVLYICIYDETSLRYCDESKLNEQIFIHPIFKVQKCIKKNGILTYENCMMIVPKDGFYQGNLKETWCETSCPVWVEIHNNNNKNKKIINAIDAVSTLASIGTVGIGVAAIFNPITAPIAIAGAVGGVLSGVWGGSRAVNELVDRKIHGQSIDVRNKQAMPAWFGAVGSALGLAASGGSALLSKAIRTGTSISKGAQITHDVIMISNLSVNSISVGYNSMHLVQQYKQNGEISVKDVFLWSAHILFICNSAVNMRFALNIIKSDQNQILKDFEESLRSNRHRREFRRLVRNTGANISDEVSRNGQIIKSLTKISNKDEFFATIVQNRKLFAFTNTQLSFTDGQIQINGVSLLSPSTFTSMSKENIVSLIKQATKGVQNTSKPSTSNNSFVSAKPLISGVTLVRDFCIENFKYLNGSIPISVKFENDMKFMSAKSLITNLVIDTMKSIIRTMKNDSYTYEDIINNLVEDILNFVWDVIKMNFSLNYPRASMFLEAYQDLFVKVVQETNQYIVTNTKEWIRAFHNWKSGSSKFAKEIQGSNSESKNTDSQLIYEDMIIVDPLEVMGLPHDIIKILIQDALNSNGSMLNVGKQLSIEMIELCKAELSEFFFKYPVPLDCNITDLTKYLNGLLNDIQIFAKKDIIFYKLVVISTNIARKATITSTLKKDIFVEAMKFLWILININFQQIPTNTPRGIRMFNPNNEGYLIKIIIAMYRCELTESEKYLHAFHKYRAIHHK